MCFPICEGFCYSRVCNDTDRCACNTARLVVRLETAESRKTFFFFFLLKLAKMMTFLQLRL